MAAASGNLEFGKTLGEGTAVGVMSLISCRFQCTPWVVYSGLPARKIADRDNAMLQMEVALLLETQGQRYRFWNRAMAAVTDTQIASP